MSEDPKGFSAGDYNLFRYCHNDPEDLTDPMGLAPYIGYSPVEGDVSRINNYYAAQAAAAGQSSSLTVAQTTLTGGSVGQKTQGKGTMSMPSEKHDSIANAQDAASSGRRWEAFHLANQDAGVTSYVEHNYPTAQIDRGRDKGKFINGDLVGGGLGTTKGTNLKAFLGTDLRKFLAAIPEGTHLVGYTTLHPNHDFYGRVNNFDAGHFKGTFGIQGRIFYRSPASLTNWEIKDSVHHVFPGE